MQWMSASNPAFTPPCMRLELVISFLGWHSWYFHLHQNSETCRKLFKHVITVLTHMISFHFSRNLDKKSEI